MVFKIDKLNDKGIEKFFTNSFDDLEKFFGFKWIVDRPSLFVVKDLGVKKAMKGSDVPTWVNGWVGPGAVYVLSPELIVKELKISKINDKKYKALIKHELVHKFYNSRTKRSKPTWLTEGLAVYLSGQLEWREVPKKFEMFLNFYDWSKMSWNEEKDCKGLYPESGFVVKMLVERFGKEKLLKLLNKIKDKDLSEKEFKDKFKKNYGFDLNYEEINKYWGNS